MPVGNHGQPKFHADNGTAECAAAGRYTDKIKLIKAVESRFPARPVWEGVTSANLARYSAVCWYSGKVLYEKLGGEVPVGLMLAAVGGSVYSAGPPTIDAHTHAPHDSSCPMVVPDCRA